MRTTINIEEEIYQIVKSISIETNLPIGQVISQLVRKALTPKVSEVTKNGFPVIGDRTKIVTNELIDNIRESEGI